MIYVIDTGYSGKHADISSEQVDEIGHGTAMINIIKGFTPKAEIIPIKVRPSMLRDELLSVFSELIDRVKVADIVLLNWVVDKDLQLDSIVSILVDRCCVVCAAGNFSKSIELYSPTTVKGVHVVACLNKSGKLAKMSNYCNDGNMKYMFGTTFITDSINGTITCSGTSVSASIYAALMSRNKTCKFMTKSFNKLKKKYNDELAY